MRIIAHGKAGAWYCPTDHYPVCHGPALVALVELPPGRRSILSLEAGQGFDDDPVKLRHFVYWPASYFAVGYRPRGSYVEALEVFITTRPGPMTPDDTDLFTFDLKNVFDLGRVCYGDALNALDTFPDLWSLIGAAVDKFWGRDVRSSGRSAPPPPRGRASPSRADRTGD